ncbi:MAG: purine-nucleoside phosphorylase [Deltaproteobacteria bacterium]|nr:MAG: purine-nucleoside phosphorylase [Deltaproteobacteria bacterium]
MLDEKARIAGVAEALQRHLGDCPPTVITLGSGLGPLVERCEVLDRIRTVELGLPASTVPGHAGEAIRARLGGAQVLLLSGRVHAYEGYSMDSVVRYVRAIHLWGVERLLLTCSAGSVRHGLPPGTLTLISDHLNLMGSNPLVGENLGGIRFPDGAKIHDPAMQAALRESAAALGITMPSAIYAAFLGPSYETAAEVRMVRTLGADLAGMSTVPELLAAARIGLRAAAVGVVSNYGAGVGDGEVDHAGVTKVANRAAAQLAEVLERALPGL